MASTLQEEKLRLTQKIAITIFAFVCNLTSPAYALPGQSLERVLQWAQNHSILPTPTLYRDAGEVYYGETNFEDGQLFLRIFFISPNGAVTEEGIGYKKNNQELTFTRTDSQGLRLIEQIYDATIADDFRNSQYVAQVGGRKFYKGQKFAYIAETESPQGLTLLRLENLAEEIRRTRLCQTHGCDV